MAASPTSPAGAGARGGTVITEKAVEKIIVAAIDSVPGTDRKSVV